ncbi:carbamoyl-phosphate synthase large subunit [Cupriavidus sp. YR651]|uniref:ATP-grasp domain-containing protein n=1 Tax=Cupriavidus sp. YR651 TaxID=1855315 RepID=UPI00088621B2|nr:ATP-grasp domain-containing protein [Cupriavidus sp. YR651]SDC22277.1 carbamoyl-phosphate synthase large subunit [Cupriavidus sp. YR651]
MSTILVTGVGAIIGYGVLRSLRAAGMGHRLVGADIYGDAVGQVWSDAFEQAPMTSSDGYIDWLADVVRRHGVDLVVPGIEQDLHRLSDAREALPGFGIRCVLNDKALVDLSKDKWHTYLALEAADDSARIPTRISGTYQELADQFGVPFLLKPRRSYASKGIVRVTSAEVFDLHAAGLGEKFIAQPIIGSDDTEFTVGMFGDGKGAVCASITLRRKLAPDGSTGKAWVAKDKALEAVVARLAGRYRPLGPTNLQFRYHEDEWRLLEFNPRISSSTSLRTAFGYNESQMCVDYFVEGRTPSQPAITRGFAARYIEDYVIHDRPDF